MAVVDFGVGNLLSVHQALEHCGAIVVCTSNAKELKKADKIILPGVGAFPNAMRALVCRGLVDPLREMACKGKPLLGICLGMQLLFDESEEFGITQGLGIVPGRVLPISAKTPTGLPLKIPSIGWNKLIPSEGSQWIGSFLERHHAEDAVYFVHSFMAMPKNQPTRLADYLYGGQRVTAVIQNKQIVGCQFHPEKSGRAGLKILKNFLEL